MRGATASPWIAGLTVAEFATRYRIGRRKVVGLIRAGKIKAINTAVGTAKPRFVIMPEALAEFEGAMQVAAEPSRAPRRLRVTVEKHYFR